MKKKISLLGSTGSIGTQTLDVVRSLGLQVCALAARSHIALLEQQIREFHPQVAAIYEEAAAHELQQRIQDTNTKVLVGMDGLCEAACMPEADTVVNAVVGIVGLQPTLAAVAADKEIALANKETLVAGGALVMDALKQHKGRLLPVDSEHSAIFQCLQGSPRKSLKKILLTASGGPFFGKKRPELETVTPEQALNHPNWNMGAKTTIDSATLMNKGLEVMEAGWLFHVPCSQIQVLIQRESIIHSMVEFADNAIIAQLGTTDMRLPIQYALTYPDRVAGPVQELDLAKVGQLTFYNPDPATFTCFAACMEAMQRGGAAPAAVNGANEEAVRLFLQKKISFLQIGDLVRAAMDNQPNVSHLTLKTILKADKDAREYVRNHI
ncbi:MULTISPECIES: 1-deoxy-D-xylulose-5-phosphate reductoisomerase [Caproicibacterium]|jgi:1-deoxy-D-xylulose-5-phosphate reductoisomerase|uniref:1-deoxy-D-xylulose 5-phosphate reductoisomerase n=1 Tax=Caproicibacterium lactatifermentans TaxID=2666138 RepID=A0ABX6PYY1_9FIRM|nr:1-deoxy-D-xylulose-5-phosphate reductoisomerase [Caproicibacterium lactatifermentans]QKO31011.1 1-deoxy-D-xylulose-5-phosphate reductoisomerase [Caproicibacterium lactatifermentans]